MKKKLFALILSFSTIALLGLTRPLHAADFSVEIDRTYLVETPNEIKVTEIRRVTNTSQNRIISKDNNEIFQILVISDNQAKLAPSFLSVETFVDGKIVQNTKGKDTEDSMEVLLPYGSSIGIKQSKEFKITYNNYGLIKRTGALTDIFIPGFQKDFKFENENTQFSYKTKIKLAKSLGEVGFLVPIPTETVDTGDFIEYTISQESLIGSNIWLQIGNSQYYQFGIKQKVKASDDINKGYFNEYRLVIPRDIVEAEVMQEVYFSKLDPVPKEVLTDDEGNLIAVFAIPSHQETTVSVEGYAIVKRLEKKISKENSGELSDIPSSQYTKYLNPAEFWEVKDAVIVARAEELRGDKSNVYDIVEANYSHIVETIDYSEVKRFGINERQGALKTLQGGAAVCMEYSDLFLTLTRAQGIPARAAFGYGYDARLEEQGQDAHQWVQVFIPKQNEWISVDVTWGESGPTLIGGDLNHFYTNVAAIDPNTPASIERTSYGKRVDLVAPEFEIKAISSITDQDILESQTELLGKYPVVTGNEFQNFVDEMTLRIQTLEIPAVLSRNAIYLVYSGIGLMAFSGLLFIKLLVDVFLRRSSKRT